MTPANSAVPNMDREPKTKTAPGSPVVRWTSRSLDQRWSFIGPPPVKAGRFRIRCNLSGSFGRYDAPPTKGGSRGAMQSPMLASTPSRNPNRPVAGPLAQSEGSSELRIDKHPQTGTIGICGAMSLQRGDSGRGQRIGAPKTRAPGRLPRSKVRPESWDPAAAGPDKAVAQESLVRSLNETPRISEPWYRRRPKA